MAMPRVLKNFNLYVDGENFAGKVDEIVLPTLTVITEDHRGGGMDSPVRLDMGLEAIEVGFTLAEHNPQVYRGFGLINQNGVQVIFRAAMMDDDTALPYVLTARGMYTEVNGGTATAGGKNPLQATISCRYFQLQLEGSTVTEIDVDNMIRIIDGVDQMAVVRGILGM